MSTQPPMDPAETADSAVLLVLTDAYPALLSEEEVRRESRHAKIDVEDALARLTAAGLIHRLNGFVFASRTAAHAGRLDYT